MNIFLSCFNGNIFFSVSPTIVSESIHTILLFHPQQWYIQIHRQTVLDHLRRIFCATVIFLASYKSFRFTNFSNNSLLAWNLSSPSFFRYIILTLHLIQFWETLIILLQRSIPTNPHRKLLFSLQVFSFCSSSIRSLSFGSSNWRFFHCIFSSLFTHTSTLQH